MKITLSYLYYLLVLTSVFLPFPSDGQNTLKSIQGFIDCNGVGLNGVRITPKNFKATPQYTRDGVFVFRGSFIVGETYLFSIEKNGYSPIAEIGLHPDKEGYLGTINMVIIPQPTEDSTKNYLPFPERNKHFNILIFPFDPYSSCKNTDKYCLKNIRNRFVLMSNSSGLSLSIKTDERYNVEAPMSYDSARAIGIWYNADMVVWGDYEQQCNWDSSLFSVKFITLGSQEQNLFKGDLGESRQRIGSFRSIVEEGAITGDIEDVIYWSLGIRKLQQEEYGAAIRYFNKITLRPNSEYASVFCLIGWCHTLSGNYEDAYKSYEEALKLNSRNPLIYICRGIQYHQQEQIGKAIKDFERAKFLDNSNTEALFQLGILQKEIGNLLDAESNLDMALKLDSIKRDNVKLAFRHTISLGISDLAKFNAIDYFKQGKIYHYIGNHKDAIDNYQKCLDINPYFSQAWYSLASSLIELKQYEVAINCYKKVVEIQPDNYAAWSDMGFTYLYIGNFEKAIECYHKVLAINPTDFIALNDMGSTYTKMGKIDEAIKCLEKATTIYPGHYLPWNNLGVISYDLEQYEDAIRYYNKSIFLNSDFALSWQNLGKAYGKSGKFEQAIECFSKSAKIDSTNSETWGDIGIMFVLIGENENAINNLNKAISINPVDPDFWYNLGVGYRGVGKNEKAIECYKKTVDLKPSYSVAWNNLGALYAEKGQNKEAIEFYQRAIDESINFIEPLFNLVLLYHNIGQVDKAVEALRLAANINPNDFRTWSYLGMIFEDSGDINQSIECYKKAIEIKPDDAETWYDLGLVYASIGENNLAINSLNKANEFNPNDNYIWYHLGSSYSKIEADSQAIFCYSKAIQIDPGDLYSYINRSDVYRKNRNLLLAERDVQQAIILQSDQGCLNAKLALICADKGDIECFYNNLAIAILKPIPYPLKVQASTDSTLQKFKNEPRFINLLEKAKE